MQNSNEYNNPELNSAGCSWKSSSLPNYYSKTYRNHVNNDKLKNHVYETKKLNRSNSLDVNNHQLISQKRSTENLSYSDIKQIRIDIKLNHNTINKITEIEKEKNNKSTSTECLLETVNSHTYRDVLHDNTKIKSECGVSEIHFLSMKMENLMHKGCPSNCSEYINTLPDALLLDIFKLLDPVSLARAGKVSQRWRKICSDPLIWRKLCQQTQWSMTFSITEPCIEPHLYHDSPIINWNETFAERFRLRRNWLTGKCLIRTFEGHTQYISCLQFDGTRIVSGSSDKTIKVWDIRTNSKWSVQTLNGHSGTVRCLALDGNRLVSGSSDKSIKVWDLSNEESWSSIACKVTMTGHNGMVRCLQVDDEKVISGSYDNTLKVWNLKTGICSMTLRGHTEAVLCLQFNEDKLVSGSHDKTIKIWRLSDGECISTLDAHQGAVTCLHFTSLPDQVISGSLDCTIKFWCTRQLKCIHTIDWKDSEGHTGVIRCLQADKWRIVSGSDDGTIKMWNLENGRRLVTLKNHTDGVTCLQFNDRLIVSGSYDKTVMLWDFNC